MAQTLVHEARGTTTQAPPSQLRGVLTTLDLVALIESWVIALVVPFAAAGGPAQRLGTYGVAAGAAVAGHLGLRASLLYKARVCESRAVEVERLLRVTAVVGVLAYVAVNVLDLVFTSGAIVTGTVLTFVNLCAVRGAYRALLRAGRRQGHFTRSVVVLGTNDEGAELVRSMRVHPELGYRVAGTLGDRPLPFDLAGDVPSLGTADDVMDTVAAVVASGANGVFVAASAFGVEHTNTLVRSLMAHGVHVHLSTGLQGVGTRRLRAHRLAYDTLFYLEPSSLERWQLVAKRVVDVVVATCALVAAAPVIAGAALLIKLEDGGPVLFRQQRVGKDGRTFGLLKLRSMTADAERRLGEVSNARDEGPLFKATHDPRVTRIGRLLRATSIDELPQLLNVLAGTMSLVGPRPALPHEAKQFPARLRLRESVAPGITGLWQVEARDNPSFRAYERFDLFYVENWSLTLDLAILLTTAAAVARRAATALLPRPRALGAAAALALE